MSGVSRTAATAAGVAVPAVLVAVTAFLAPLPAGSGARGPEQIRLPVQDTVSVCPGPLALGAEAEGLDEEFASAGAPDTRARAVTVETGAPDGSSRAAAIRAETFGLQPASGGAGSSGGADAEDSPAEGAAGEDLSAEREVRFETGAGDPFVTGSDHIDGPALFTGLAAEESPALTSAVQTAQADEGDLAGLAAHSCDRTVSRAVFSGASTMTGDDARLLLGNPTDAPVSVRIALTGETGPVDIAGADALTVAPHSVRDVPLGALATGVPVLGAEVAAEDGRVSAVLQHVRRDGLDARGIEYAAAEAGFAESVSVPVATVGPLRLRVTNPGDEAVTAELSGFSAEGPVPLEAGSVSVPARGTAEVELGEGLGEGSVRVSADAPVSASALVTAETGPGEDLAHYAAAEPLGDTQLLVLPELPADESEGGDDAEGESGEGEDSADGSADAVESGGSLVLSEGSGTVEIAAIGAEGAQTDSRLVELAADRATVLGLGDFPGATALELRNPAGAEVSAALGVRTGAGVSGLAVPAPPTGVDYRDVRLER
ncbi:DUF5719 family protein [Brevibacterium album]|uniref:DUF5719 family protein n=1 Tax=Brevibacterium album TaxID=417948 RepID=UPI00040FC54C|nr:DUF5719 family protein [Brevibacterium album]